MAIQIGVGRESNIGGREAATEAIYDALQYIDSQKVSLGMVFASNEYEIGSVLSGAKNQLGNVPLIGFSTSGEFTSAGRHSRSVVVALMGGEGVEGKAEWVPDYAADPGRAAQNLSNALGLNAEGHGALFLVADGLGGDGQTLLQNLAFPGYQITGCLSGGDPLREFTAQIGGSQTGVGGVSGATLSGGNIKLGIGSAHGWEPVGANFKVTAIRENWIQSLDGKPSSDQYAALFGHRPRDWAFPPLNTLVRLYPLGMEQENRKSLLIRTPLRIEADGSLRMNTHIEEGSVGHLLVGRADLCMEAARRAAGDAVKMLGRATAKIALVFVDESWNMLLKGQPGNEIQAVQEVLGKNIPIAGGYTFGQFAPMNGDPFPSALNQHITVVLVGEEENY